MKEQFDSEHADFERIDEQAGEWLMTKDRGFTASEQDGFFQWLAEDPRHGERYAELERTWGNFDLLVEWRPEHSETPNPDLLSPTFSQWWSKYLPLASGIAAAVVVAFVAFFVVQSGNYSDKDQVTYLVSKDYEYQVLEDGSEVDMNEGAEIAVEYTSDRRLVRLLAGEAHFTVAKNPNRPFVVLVGGTEVRAIGTAFNVKLEPEGLEVLVTEGHVRLENSSIVGRSKGREEVLDTETHDLIAGQASVVSVESTKPKIAHVSKEEIAERLFWKHVLFEFESTPLAEAVRAFNLRNQTKLVVEDAALESFPIEATFRSNNVEGFARLVEIMCEAEIDRSEEGVIKIRQPR